MSYYARRFLFSLLGFPLTISLGTDSSPPNDLRHVGESSHFSEPSYLSESLDPNGCLSSASSSPGPGVEHHSVGGSGVEWPFQIYKSSSNRPPVMQINRTFEHEPLAPGLIFFTVSDFLTVTDFPNPSHVKHPGAYIFTDAGQLVWSSPKTTASNMKWQIFDNAPTLTYWQGFWTVGKIIGHGYGNITFLDDEFRVKTVFCPNFGLHSPEDLRDCQADLHESWLTDRNTIIVSAYNATQRDLTSVGGAVDGWVWDSQFYEVDPLSGEILFKWTSLEHVPINSTRFELGSGGTKDSPFDYFHINSVINVDNEHYLVGSRHCWTVFYLNKAGEIQWQFSGDNGGDFGKLPADGHFRWQHHVRAHNVSHDFMDISIFNNDVDLASDEEFPTDLLVYRLPRTPVQSSTKSQAVLKRAQQNVPQIFSGSQGSYIPDLPDSNGHQFAAFGQNPLMKEFDDQGKVLWEGRIGVDNTVQIYRGFKQIWHATPHYEPSLAVEKDESGKVHGYVSWNGATDVERWNVYAGKSKDDMRFVGSCGYRGFETKFNVACWAKYVQVGAVQSGKHVRKSGIVEVS